jgi:hypothetical protein
MHDSEIQTFIKALDTTKSLDAEAAWSQLRPLEIEVVPHLANFYSRAKKWQGRAWLIYQAIRYSRASEDAFQLGLKALNDKSSVVRHRACSLCAYSLRREAVPALTSLFSHRDQNTVADARAAVDAIQHQDHNYFHDRTHSGQVRWEVS